MNSLVALIRELLPGTTQANRLLRLHTRLGVNALVPQSIEGREAIASGAGFRFEIIALATDAELDLRALLGTPALLALLTADSRDELRPWHGHITAAECLGSNQGVARYRLVLEPWLAMLAYRQDSFIHQDQTLPDIVNTVFERYLKRGGLMADWRWELEDADRYPRRSLTTQFNETDLAFVQRLLTDEGLFYWFEHEGRPESSTLGKHRLVIADHNGAFQPGTAESIRFHRRDVTEKQDSIQQWQVQASRHPTQLHLNSWDYRTLSSRAVTQTAEAAPVPLEQQVNPGQYIYPDRGYGEYLARVHCETESAWATRVDGAGTHRRMAPGLHFVLTGHPGIVAPQVCVAVDHQMRNNLSADVGNAVASLIGLPQGKPSTSDFYENSFTAIPAERTFRPLRRSDSGQPIYPRPAVSNLQSAIVVGPADQPVYTDRDHRIRVQFHWQRGTGGQQQLEHPAHADNAPGDGTVGTWVRVGTSLAGQNWGSNFIPRVGQEVLIRFMDGNIDRPVVVGSVYNGRGNTDAAHNAVAANAGVATANASPWFAGSRGGHAHAAVLSGYKTQALDQSQTGTGGYNQLVFDDSPCESRLALSTTQYATALALGHIRQQDDNQRLVNRGHGAELTTQACGILRAGAGLLLSTEGGAGEQLSASGANTALIEARGLIKALADTAQAQQADMPGDFSTEHRPVIKSLDEISESLAATDQREPASRSNRSGHGNAIAWTRPDLVTSAPAGIVSVASEDQIMAAGRNLSLSAQDINICAGDQLNVSVANGLRLFTYGGAETPEKPDQETGIALHAARGQVSVQAQSAKASIAADQTVTLSSSQSSADISARKRILLTASGAGLQIKGGDITLTAPGAVTFHAAQHVLSSGQGVSASSLQFSKSELYNERFVLRDDQTGDLLPMEPYRIVDNRGDVVAQGWTDDKGRTIRVRTPKPVEVRLLHGFGDEGQTG